MKPIIEKKGKKIQFYNKLAEIYIRKEKNRYELAEEYGTMPNTLYGCFKKRGIEIWDVGSPKTKRNDEICNLYKEKKFNRKELSKKYGIKVTRITQYLKARGIKLWDRQVKEGKEKTIKTTPYYSWKEDIFSSDYARLFYEYNK